MQVVQLGETLGAQVSRETVVLIRIKRSARPELLEQIWNHEEIVSSTMLQVDKAGETKRLDGVLELHSAHFPQFSGR